MSVYSVTINLDTATLNQLNASAYSLCCLLAAQVGDASALPLLWSINKSFVSHNVVNWPATCTVFTAAAPGGTEPLAAGDVVTMGWSTPMNLGQLLTVQATGNGTVSNVGEQSVFAVLNASTTGQLCGLAAGPPLCALPLLGQTGQVFNSLPKIMLLFANGQLPPLGTAIDKWPGGRTAALLVDASQGNNPTVSFNINTGWDYNQQAWGTSVPFTDELAPYLIAQEQVLFEQSMLLVQQRLPTG
jgi:hypothetical protein